MAWPALQQISQPLIPAVSFPIAPGQQLYGGMAWPTPPPLPYDITPPPPGGGGVVNVVYRDGLGFQRHHLAYYGDPSAAGGLCRKACHAHPDPTQCCALKAGLQDCKDPDCSGGAFTATKAPTSTYQNLVASDCLSWPSCALHPMRAQCCAAKPAGCDPACAGFPSGIPGVLPGAPPPQLTTLWAAPGQVPQLTYPKTGDCRDWVPCASMPDPAVCCLSKPPGCDTSCVNRVFVGQRPGLQPGQIQVAYDGSTFAEDDQAVDELYGVDAGMPGTG